MRVSRSLLHARPLCKPVREHLKQDTAQVHDHGLPCTTSPATRHLTPSLCHPCMVGMLYRYVHHSKSASRRGAVQVQHACTVHPSPDRPVTPMKYIIIIITIPRKEIAMLSIHIPGQSAGAAGWASPRSRRRPVAAPVAATHLRGPPPPVHGPPARRAPHAPYGSALARTPQLHLSPRAACMCSQGVMNPPRTAAQQKPRQPPSTALHGAGVAVGAGGASRTPGHRCECLLQLLQR